MSRGVSVFLQVKRGSHAGSPRALPGSSLRRMLWPCYRSRPFPAQGDAAAPSQVHGHIADVLRHDLGVGPKVAERRYFGGTHVQVFTMHFLPAISSGQLA
jgi:hypothetical protein